MGNNNRILFFFVHPSKFHLFRLTINNLILAGHKVDILITSKDVLENLVKNEKWNYTNIFPEGRKIKWLPTKLGASFNLVRTLIRLYNYTKDKKYDLFVTDDLLTFIGKLRKIPTILFQDDDLAAVPESFILLSTASYILAPACTNFKKYNKKKISFIGYKQSAYLLPNQFTPKKSIVAKYLSEPQSYYLIRLVSLSATHDVGKSGLTDKDVLKIIKILETNGKVLITSERSLPSSLERYRLNIKPNEMIHFISFAKLFISDSQTMSAEAAILGTPYIRFNDFIGKISYLDELEKKYELGYGIKTNEKKELFSLVHKFELQHNTNKHFKMHQKVLLETLDLSKFMTWLFSDYSNNIKLVNNYSKTKKVFIS